METQESAHPTEIHVLHVAVAERDAARPQCGAFEAAALKVTVHEHRAITQRRVLETAADQTAILRKHRAVQGKD